MNNLIAYCLFSFISCVVIYFAFWISEHEYKRNKADIDRHTKEAEETSKKLRS